MALFGVFIVVPMLGAIALSLFRWNGLGTPHWAGASNWIQFAHDPLARQALTVTAKVVVLSWVLQTPISMALGLFTAGRQRYRSVYATLYVLPLLLSTAIIALIAWQFIPFHTLLYQMGRRQIPGVLYEAARLDGASPAQMFWRVTLPQLRYTIVTSSTVIIVGSLTYFDIVYIMTNGGPGYTTRVLSLDMYQAAFQQNEFGYASVLAVVIGVFGFSGFAATSSQQEGAA